MVRKRKDPLTRKELVEALEYKVCTLTYTPQGSMRKVVRVTLDAEIIAKLDNRPEGFESTREAALFDAHSVNALDIDTNRWLTIPIGDIISISVP